MNAGGFLACERFVTHITGFATLAGIDLARGNIRAAAGILLVPAFFLLGVIISAWLTTRRLHHGRPPNYELLMEIIALCLFFASVGGTFDLFGIFGEDFYLRHDFVLLALLCLASGLQNAAITTSSGATIRTTHLTGITTDLGIGLVDAYDHRHDPKMRSEILKKNNLRLGTIAAFISGGAVGATLFLNYKYLGFLLPMFIACYAAVIARRLGAEQSSLQKS